MKIKIPAGSVCISIEEYTDMISTETRTQECIRRLRRECVAARSLANEKHMRIYDDISVEKVAEIMGFSIQPFIDKPAERDEGEME